LNRRGALTDDLIRGMAAVAARPVPRRRPAAVEDAERAPGELRAVATGERIACRGETFAVTVAPANAKDHRGRRR
jgi:hypothetical protein